MTQGIKAFFDLPDVASVIATPAADAPESIETPDHEQYPAEEWAVTPQPRDPGARDHADSMDRIHQETLKHAQDLMELAFNVDLRSARGIAEVASTMYGRAMEAKNAKRDAYLKAQKLALDYRKMDLEEKRAMGGGEGGGTIIAGDAVVLREDRNELVKRIREQNKITSQES